jgi:hypothetical protein
MYMPTYNSSNTNFGSSLSISEPNNNGIRYNTKINSFITSAGATAAPVVITVENVNNIMLDKELVTMIQNIQEHFISPYVEFRMDPSTNQIGGFDPLYNLEDNIQDGFLDIDPSTNTLSRTVDVNGVTKTTTEKLMIDLHKYVEEVKSLPRNIDISNNDVELSKQDASFLIATYGLKTITVANRGLLCWIENKMLNSTIIALQEERIQSSNMQSSLVFDITATATLDIRYLAYLKKHVHVATDHPDYDSAFLSTGVFRAELLAAFV